MEYKEDELYHFGVPGMRWGFRRYQNRDGTLTARGKKHYDKELRKIKKKAAYLKNKKRTQAKIDKLETERKAVKQLQNEVKLEKQKAKTKQSVKTKKIDSMTNDELKAVTERLTLEKNYINALSEQSERGRSKVNKLLGSALASASEDISKQLIKSAMAAAANKALNLEDESKVYANNKKK